SPFPPLLSISLFFSTHPPTTALYTLSLHDALPIFPIVIRIDDFRRPLGDYVANQVESLGFSVNRRYMSAGGAFQTVYFGPPDTGDRKSTRLNSSHDQISYAVFCLKKKKKKKNTIDV